MRSEMPAGTHRAYLGTQKHRKNESQRSFILYESLNAAAVDKEQSPRFHKVNDKSQLDFIWAGISCPASKGKNCWLMGGLGFFLFAFFFFSFS